MKQLKTQKATKMTDQAQAQVTEPKKRGTAKGTVRKPQEVLAIVTIKNASGEVYDLSKETGNVAEVVLMKPKDWKAVTSAMSANPQAFITELTVPKAD